MVHCADTASILGTDPYPVPRNPLSLVTNWTRRTARAAGRQAVIQVVQVFDDGVYAGKHGRTPTLDEIRSMSWQAIVAGASGLAFFSLPNLHVNPDVPFATSWAWLSSVVQDVLAFQEVLLSNPAPAVLARSASGETPAWLGTRAHWHAANGTSDYVVFAAADGSAAGGTVRFELPPGVARAVAVTVHGDRNASVANAKEEGPIKLRGDGRGWEDQILRFGLRVYRVRTE